MAVKIKLKRIGKIRVPQYRIVVADARTARSGRAIEEIGIYHPKEEPSLIRVDSERVQYWLSVGAQPTEPVMAILKVTGDWQKFKGLPGAEGTLKVAEPRRSTARPSSMPPPRRPSGRRTGWTRSRPSGEEGRRGTRGGQGRGRSAARPRPRPKRQRNPPPSRRRADDRLRGRRGNRA